MNKKDYLDALAKALDCLSREKRSEILSFYQEAIDDRIEEGMSEEEAVCAMGPVELAAESILGGAPVVPRAVAKTRRKKSRAALGSCHRGISPCGFRSRSRSCSRWRRCIRASGLRLRIWLVAAVCMFALPFGLYLVWCGVMTGTLAFALAQTGLGCVLEASACSCSTRRFRRAALLAVLSQKWIRKARLSVQTLRSR